MNAQESDQRNVVRWLQLLAAVGLPLLLAYLAFAGLVNPQFAELRELIRDNRDAIISNRDLISSNRDLISSNREAIAANRSSIERLEDRINLFAEVLILATTNENVTEVELRNLLNSGGE